MKRKRILETLWLAATILTRPKGPQILSKDHSTVMYPAYIISWYSQVNLM